MMTKDEGFTKSEKKKRKYFFCFIFYLYLCSRNN